MKIFKCLAVAAFFAAGSAFAGPIGYAVATCGTFTKPAPNSPMSGTWTCASAASLGVSNMIGEFISYTSDFSNGLSSSTSATTNWTSTGATFAIGTDTTTSLGGTNSNPPTSADGLTLNTLTNNPNGWGPGGFVFAGFYDTASVFGTPTISFTNQSVGGAALQATGYAQVVYAYSTSATPEPSSLLLFGSGLVGLAAFGRRKLAGR